MIRLLAASLLFVTISPIAAQVPIPLLGRWRVSRILPTERPACWDEEQAKTLLGTTLLYQPHFMIWQGGRVPLIGIEAVTRTLNRRQFSSEYTVTLDTLGIAVPAIREVDLQHEDADVTGSTTEVPGDTVLLAGPSRIVVSACGIYYEAIRAKP